MRTKTLRHVWLESTNKTGSTVTIEPLVNDETSGTSGITGTLDFTDSNDVGYERRRERRVGFRRQFDWVQLKISHNTKNHRFKMRALEMSYITKGIR